MNDLQSTLTQKLRHNWLIDAILALTALVTVLSSLYFLAFPVGGYQGGRNPYYDLVVIFSRYTWDFLHTWFGVGMILAALVHIVIHWAWITGTIQRVWRVVSGQRKRLGLRLSYNIILDGTIALSFLVCAVSGVTFLFFPNSGRSSQIVFFSKDIWDLIHTWSGVVMVITAVLHFVLHWKWIVNITGKMFARRPSKPKHAEVTNLTPGNELGNN